MQVDIQATLPGVHVIVARPVVVNLATVANAIIAQFGGPSVLLTQLARITEGPVDVDQAGRFLEPYLQPIKSAFQSSAVDTVALIIEAIRQLALVDYKTLSVGPLGADGKPSGDLQMNLEALAGTDPTKVDRDLGVCPIPLFAFAESEFETLTQGRSVDEAVEILRRHDILQYFFPAADQAALGLVDRGVTDRTQLTKIVAEAPAIGHPFGASEITPVQYGLVEVVEALEHQGLVTEGELNIAITEPGKETRATVRFKPRESLLSKLLNRFSVHLDLTKLTRLD